MANNEHADSSEDEEAVYSLTEAIDDMMFDLAVSTQNNYRQRITEFQRWYRDNYGRELDSKPKLKRKHLRLYFASKQRTCSQMRAVIIVIKSLTRHLKKRGVLQVDVGHGFESGKQLAPKHERNMSSADVNLFFVEAQKKNDPSTFYLVSLLAYCGIRRMALSKIAKSDVIKSDNQKNGIVTSSYAVRVRKAKGSKTRLVSCSEKMGRGLYEWAQSLPTMYLFPSKGLPEM